MNLFENLNVYKESKIIKDEKDIEQITESIGEDDYENEILEIVLMGFETGHQVWNSYEDFADDPDMDHISNKEDAWNFYIDCVDMGPEEFYEEYAGMLDFSEDFIAMYGEEDDLD